MNDQENESVFPADNDGERAVENPAVELLPPARFEIYQSRCSPLSSGQVGPK
jgi:hypothetical protein